MKQGPVWGRPALGLMQAPKSGCLLPLHPLGLAFLTLAPPFSSALYFWI